MNPEFPAIEEVTSELAASGLAVDAPELHGALCGWLAGGGRDDARWIASVLADPELPQEVPGSALAQMRKATAAQLEDRNFELQLLLPEDGAALQERSGALFAWCRGFLGGFGLAAGNAPPLSDEGQEVLGDLAKFAAASPQEDGDEEDEEAMMEIEEFVRLAALLLHGDCVLGARHRQSLH